MGNGERGRSRAAALGLHFGDAGVKMGKLPASNFRLSPRHNLERHLTWLKASGFKKLVNELRFQSATGNFLVETTVPSIDEDETPIDLDGAEDIVFPEYLDFEMPFTYEDLKLVTANPYGIVQVLDWDGKRNIFNGHLIDLDWQVEEQTAKVRLLGSVPLVRAPITLVVVQSGPDTVDITWTDQSGAAINHQISWSIDPTTIIEEFLTESSDPFFINYDGLPFSGTFYFVVQTITENGISEFSNIASVVFVTQQQRFTEDNVGRTLEDGSPRTLEET